MTRPSAIKSVMAVHERLRSSRSPGRAFSSSAKTSWSVAFVRKLIFLLPPGAVKRARFPIYNPYRWFPNSVDLRINFVSSFWARFRTFEFKHFIKNSIPASNSLRAKNQTSSRYLEIFKLLNFQKCGKKKPKN